MAKYIRLSPSIRVRVRRRPFLNYGTAIELIFQRRLWWFLFTPITGRYYCLNVYDFWDPCGFHDEGGPMEGQPLRSEFAYGGHSESWKPRHFDLNKRIQAIYLEIVGQQAEREHIDQQIKKSMKL